MQLYVSQDRVTELGRVRYFARCRLELSSYDQEQLRRYGAAPLIEPPIMPPDAMGPPLEAVLTAEQFQALMSPDGYQFDSTDLRRVGAFIERLTAACQELVPYWENAAQFRKDFTVSLPSALPPTA